MDQKPKKLELNDIESLKSLLGTISFQSQDLQNQIRSLSLDLKWLNIEEITPEEFKEIISSLLVKIFNLIKEEIIKNFEKDSFPLLEIPAGTLLRTTNFEPKDINELSKINDFEVRFRLVFELARLIIDSTPLVTTLSEATIESNGRLKRVKISIIQRLINFAKDSNSIDTRKVSEDDFRELDSTLQFQITNLLLEQQLNPKLSGIQGKLKNLNERNKLFGDKEMEISSDISFVLNQLKELLIVYKKKNGQDTKTILIDLLTGSLYRNIFEDWVKKFVNKENLLTEFGNIFFNDLNGVVRNTKEKANASKVVVERLKMQETRLFLEAIDLDLGDEQILVYIIIEIVEEFYLTAEGCDYIKQFFNLLIDSLVTVNPKWMTEELGKIIELFSNKLESYNSIIESISTARKDLTKKKGEIPIDLRVTRFDKEHAARLTLSRDLINFRLEKLRELEAKFTQKIKLLNTLIPDLLANKITQKTATLILILMLREALLYKNDPADDILNQLFDPQAITLLTNTFDRPDLDAVIENNQIIIENDLVVSTVTTIDELKLDELLAQRMTTAYEYIIDLVFHGWTDGQSSLRTEFIDWMSKTNIINNSAAIELITERFALLIYEDLSKENTEFIYLDSQSRKIVGDLKNNSEVIARIIIDYLMKSPNIDVHNDNYDAFTRSFKEGLNIIESDKFTIIRLNRTSYDVLKQTSAKEWIGGQNRQRIQMFQARKGSDIRLVIGITGHGHNEKHS